MKKIVRNASLFGAVIGVALTWSSVVTAQTETYDYLRPREVRTKKQTQQPVQVQQNEAPARVYVPPVQVKTQKRVVPAAVVRPVFTPLSGFTMLGSTGAKVSELQGLLFAVGELSASPSGFFGAQTDAALKRFQCRQMSLCSGSVDSTGYGAYGRRTKAALLEYISSLSSNESDTPEQIAYTPQVPQVQQQAPVYQSCTFAGKVVEHGASVQAFQTSSVSSPYSCSQFASTRVCNNGVLSGDSRYAYASCVASQPSGCTVGNTSLENGSTRTFYNTPQVTYGSSCDTYAQQRTCTNGTMSGQGTYVFSSCTAAAPLSCALDGVTVQHGASQTFYSTTLVGMGTSCGSVGQSRTCTNGVLGGSSNYARATCTAATSSSCVIDGTTIGDGVSKTLFSSRQVAFGTACTSAQGTRTCVKGILQGDEKYQYGTCTVGAASSCTLDGKTVSHGASETFYSQKTVPFGQNCGKLSGVRKCANGVFDGTNTYAYSSCVVGDAASCTLDGVTVAHGATREFYSESSAPFGQTCAKFSVVRKCTNGVFDGDQKYSKATCAVAGPATCTLDSVSVAHTTSATFYKANKVAAYESCDSMKASRTCTNGVLGGDAAYKYGSCSSLGNPTITTDKTAYKLSEPITVTVNNGSQVRPDEFVQIVTAGSAFPPAAANLKGWLYTNNTQTRSTSGTQPATVTFAPAHPTNFSLPFGDYEAIFVTKPSADAAGVKKGSAFFSISIADSCVLDGVTVDHTTSKDFYSTKTVAKYESCDSFKKARTCTNGVLGGDAAYKYGSCTPKDAPSVTTNKAEYKLGEQVDVTFANMSAMRPDEWVYIVTAGSAFPPAAAAQKGVLYTNNGATRGTTGVADGTVQFTTTKPANFNLPLGSYEAWVVSAPSASGTRAKMAGTPFKVAVADSCTLDGATVNHTEKRDFFSRAAAPSYDACTNYKQTLTCTNGTLSGTPATYNKKECVQKDPAVTMSTNVLSYGDDVTVSYTDASGKQASAEWIGIYTATETDKTKYKAWAYLTGTTTAGAAGVDGSVTFKDTGTKIGYGSFKAKMYHGAGAAAVAIPGAEVSFTINNPAVCTLDSATVAHAASRQFFSLQSVTTGDTCPKHAQTRTCTNGVLSGDAQYQYANCK